MSPKDLNRAYVINGHDLGIVLAGMNGRPPLVPNPRDVAEFIIDRIAQPAEAGHITREQLAKVLDGFTVWVTPGNGQSTGSTFAGKIANAADAATRLLDLIAAQEPERGSAEPDDDVVDAHICCECARCGNQFKPDQVCDACRKFLRDRYDLAEPGHAGTDPELSAMAALLPALPLVAALKQDARERVMDWALRRATDRLAPF